MTECLSAEMRDALPDLIHGSLDAAHAAMIEAHVASCPECAAELELLAAVVASATRAPALDLSRIVAALPTPTGRGLLLHQGGSQPVGSRKPQTLWSRPLLRIAATVAIVTAGGLSLLVGRDTLNPERQARPVAAAPTPAPATAPTPSRVLATAPVHAERETPAVRQVASAAGLSLVGETQDLSYGHLATLLSEMDHLDPIPGAEPEAITPAIGASDGSGIIQ